MTGNAPFENLAKPIVRQTKTASSFIKNMQHPFRGGKVNYLREPSFRGWLLAGIPFYALAAKKRLSLWRWLLIIVPHLHLLDGEANNTAHEESIDSHKVYTWNFKNAKDSAAFSVMLRATGTLICVLYALFGPDPWVKKQQSRLSLQEQLEDVVSRRHLVTGKLSGSPKPRERALLVREGIQLNLQEQVLREAIKAQEAEMGLKHE